MASKEVRINTTSPNGQNSTTSDYNTLLTDAPILAFDTYSQTRGAKNYELSNHLGNVLVVITDKKYNCINNEVYGADFKIGKGGFTGGWSEQNSGWSTTFTGPYSSVIKDNGRLKTTATVTYGGNRNVVNTFNIGESYTFTFDLDIGTTSGIYVNARATNGSSPYTGTNLAQIYVTASGTYTLTFTATTATTQLLFEKGTYGTSYFYIDNARVAETDVTTYNYYVADVVTANDYSPFGAPLAGRSYTAPNSDYRFAFNGKEKDNEVNGEGNAYDFGARIYDPRLGRWLSVDPLQEKYVSFSPYNYSINSPIMLGDPDGNKVVVKTTKYKMVNGEKVKLGLIKSLFLKADIIDRSVIIHNAKVIDLTGKQSKEEMDEFAKSVQKEIIDKWSTCNDPNSDEEGFVTNSKKQKIRVTTTFAQDVTVANSETDIKTGDNVFALVYNNDYRNINGSAAGTARPSKQIAYISISSLNSDGVPEETLVAHETGHLGGLPDSKNKDDMIDKIMYNQPDGRANRPHPNEYTKFYRNGMGGVVRTGDNAVDLKPSR